MPGNVAFATVSTEQSATLAENDTSTQYKPRRFDRVGPLHHVQRKDPAAWIALLEPALPANLRQNSNRSSSATLDTVHVAELLLAAQRPLSVDSGIDVLYHMGMADGRWQAVIALVKRIVEDFAFPRSLPQIQSTWPWPTEGTLADLCSSPVTLDSQRAISQTAVPLSLDELTGDNKPENMMPMERLQHETLGQIWRSLGVMIVACADDVVKPEILEIIAYLHHRGIMPESIYSHKPSADETAIQQPPTLHLLSSHVLTSLSDAAWRAHEKVIVDEAKTRGSKYVSIRPEVPGSAYRVTVAGLRPEVWLELVLWSCLHGGWILEGAAVLRLIHSKSKGLQWKPFSWRSIAGARSDKVEAWDWDRLVYVFKTRPPSTVDPPDEPAEDVQRTVSSEVVNAYVDALLVALDVGVGSRGAPASFILSQLNVLRSFLERSNLKLASGSWDAIVLRFFESQGDVALHSKSFQELVSLSPRFGREVRSGNTQVLPPYVLDGSAAILGLCHRALRLHIKAGNLDGALRLFGQMQKYTDDNKRSSIVDFFKTVQRNGNALSAERDGLFTNNLSKIDYPSFDLQISATILGPFLDLVTDAKAYDLGKWLLYSNEIEGPVISDAIYNDLAIVPALVKFAAATDDRALLSNVLRSLNTGDGSEGPGRLLALNVLTSFLDSQVNLRQWPAAERILRYLRDTPGFYWNTGNLALVARSMIIHDARSEGDETLQEHAASAKGIFTDMVNGHYNSDLGKKPYLVNLQVDQVLLVVSAIGPRWAKTCAELRLPPTHIQMSLAISKFNNIVNAVVEAYGAVAARGLVEKFWPHALRDLQEKQVRDKTKVAPRRPAVLDEAEQHRRLLRLPGLEDQTVAIYGGVQPDIMTIWPLLQRAMQELNAASTDAASLRGYSVDSHLGAVSSEGALFDQDRIADSPVDTSPSRLVIWAARCLRALGSADEDIEKELTVGLEDRRLQEVRKGLPEIFGSGGEGCDGSVAE